MQAEWPGAKSSPEIARGKMRRALGFFASSPCEKMFFCYERTCRLHESIEVPRVRPRVSAGGDARVRVRFRAVGGGVRLRPHQALADTRGDSVTAQEHVAVPGTAAGGGSSDRRLAGRFHAADQSGPAGPPSWHPRALDQK